VRTVCITVATVRTPGRVPAATCHTLSVKYLCRPFPCTVDNRITTLDQQNAQCFSSDICTI